MTPARFRIRAAHFPDETPLVRELFLEYARWLDFDLCFQGFDAELAGLPGSYAPPDGNVWIARQREAVLGVVALRPHGGHGRAGGQCELKRLWVRPTGRGKGMGRSLSLRVIQAARELGYGQMVLDSHRSMAAALALYRSLGFTSRREPVRDPHPDLVYLELDLESGG